MLLLNMLKYRKWRKLPYYLGFTIPGFEINLFNNGSFTVEPLHLNPSNNWCFEANYDCFEKEVRIIKIGRLYLVFVRVLLYKINEIIAICQHGRPHRW